MSTKNIKIIIDHLIGYFKKFVFYFLAISVANVILLRFVPPLFTPLMFIRVVEQSLNGQAIQLKYNWTSSNKIAPYVGQAVIAAEDQLFYSHFGFDVDAIKKAYKHNSNSKSTLKGASTITQQVAKNLFLWSERSYIRKGLEAYFTILLEIFWSKNRILEVYVNIVELGNGIYGVEAASNYYYKKSALNLSKNESALFAAILPNPRKWSVKIPSKYIVKRKNWIFRNMRKVGA